MIARVREVGGDDAVRNLKELLVFRDVLDKARSVEKTHGAHAAAVREWSGGYTVDEIHQDLQRMQRTLKPDEWNLLTQAADEIDAMVARTRDRLVRAGVISRDLAEHLEREFPHYVPIDIVDDLDDPVTIPVGRKITLLK